MDGERERGMFLKNRWMDGWRERDVFDGWMDGWVWEFVEISNAEYEQ